MHKSSLLPVEAVSSMNMLLEFGIEPVLTEPCAIANAWANQVRTRWARDCRMKVNSYGGWCCYGGL